MPVEVKMSEDLACSLCGMAGHTARSPACPIRAFTGEPSPASNQEGEGLPILLCFRILHSQTMAHRSLSTPTAFLNRKHA